MGWMCCFGSEKRSTIKIVSEDGSSKRFKAPLSVKEALANHPHLHQYMLFNAETVRKLGAWARPLPDTRLLEPGKLYVLRPPAAAPTPPRNSRFSGGLTEKEPVTPDATRDSSRKLSSPEEAGDSARVSSASSVKKVSFSNKDISAEERRASSLPRKVCFADSHAESSNNIESPRSVSLPRKVYSLASNVNDRAISPTRRMLLSMAKEEALKGKAKESAIPCGLEEGATRVKVVITKQQLACLLGGKEEEAVSSSIMANVAAQHSSREGSGTWRPSLDSILESKPSQTEHSLSQKPKDHP